MQRVIGNIKTGIILKDVSLTVHSGEVLAVLGSKGFTEITQSAFRITELCVSFR